MFTEMYKKAVLARVVPTPVSLTFGEGFCILRDGIEVEIITAAELSAEERIRVEKALVKFPNFKPALTFKACGCTAGFAPEQYAVSVAEKSLQLRAKEYHGIDYALKTLRQLSEPVRGVERLTNEMIPCCEIEDQPKLAFRAIHFCIFPETRMTTVIKNLRLAAYHKFNYAVIESWGVFPFRSHPEFAWKNKKKPIEEFIALRDAADECGIKIIPQFNIFGHASMARAVTCKHAILDENPELAPLFEPAGWSFCLSSPATRKVVTDLVLELYDFYRRPAFFHLGCDEAYDFQTCADCAAQDSAALIGGHITYFHDLFADRGTRTIIWHDMLFDRKDPRWKDCIAVGDERTATLADVLPKDLILADWQYSPAPKDNPAHEWPTSLYLQEKGFDVAVCPWMDTQGMLDLCKMAVRRNLFGMIETTWHTAFNGPYYAMMVYASIFSWLGSEPERYPDRGIMAHHIRQVSQDMGGLTEYVDFGHSDWQVFQDQA